MTDLMIVALDKRYSIICMADHVTTENMWDNVIGHVSADKNKRKFDVELNGEKLGRVNWFKDAMPILENKLGIECQFMISSTYK